MALDSTSLFFPTDVVLVRGARSPENQGLFDGWRQDLSHYGVQNITAPGSEYWPMIDHQQTAAEVASAIELSAKPTLIIGHSYGGNIAYQVLRRYPELREKILGVIHMASPLKMQMGVFPEPSPDLKVPVIGFRGLHDAMVPVIITGSRIDTKMYELKCGHQDFVSAETVRQTVLALVQAELAKVS